MSAAPPTEFVVTDFRQRQDRTRPIDVLGGLERLRETLTERGLRLNNTSRLPSYIEALKRSFAKPRPLTDEEDVRQFLTAISEGQYVLDAYEGLALPPEVPDWVSHFKLALKGAAVPAADDKARDKMVELIIASAAKKGGYGVLLNEPDVRISDKETTLVTAAKRIRTLGALDGRVREGVSQIKKWELPGFVTVDFTAALEIHDGFYFSPVPADPRTFQAHMRDQIVPHLTDEALDTWLAGQSLAIGVVGFAYAPLLVASGGHSQVCILRTWVQRALGDATSPSVSFLMGLVGRIDFS